MPIWSDFFRLFQYANEKDPLSAIKDPKNFGSAGVAQPEALGIDYETAGGAGGQTSYRQTHDMIDTTTLANRTMRYKEYERLRNVPEIEAAMTVFSDEACVTGDTKIATPHGFLTIKELVDNFKDERFLVYCYDFKNKDYTLGWAFSPRFVKQEETVTISLDNGSQYTATADHQVLKKDGTWIETGKLKFGDSLMPFYRILADTPLKHKQYPRIFTRNKGWIHERQFVDDWKNGKTDPILERLNRFCRAIYSGLTNRQIAKLMDYDWTTMEAWLAKEGFTVREIRRLGSRKEERRVVGVEKSGIKDVYDISVEDHKCFATDSVILHNCQKDEEGNVLKIKTDNDEVKEEIEFLFFHRKMLNINRHAWTWFKNLCIFGDLFLEIIVNSESPKDGIFRLLPLPPETMYRIETTKGRLIEYQQSKEGPDYQAIVRGNVQTQTDTELKNATAIRFAPYQIIHFRIGDDRKTFYPYGQSLVEPARGPAHSLRLMEDSMVVYRLTRAPERRVFYIDVGQLPPHKADFLLDRVKDQYRKRKVTSNRGTPGANSVEERWMPPAPDEDIWWPIRPNSNSRIDTLPGAENLGEIDDAIYFRNKLLISLNFPKNYLNNEDPAATRITLSAQDVKFARMIERLQSHFEDGMLEIAERHLSLKGYPEESYQDLKIKMTSPSDWRELSRAEVVTARYSNAGSLKGSQIMSDFDIYTKILKYSPDETEEMLARLKIQKLDDLKMQILGQNPQLVGVGIPSTTDQSQNEIGSDAGGPDLMPQPEDQGQSEEQPTPEGGQMPENPAPVTEKKTNISMAEPTDDDIKKYDLELQNYDYEQDIEDIDYSIGDQ